MADCAVLGIGNRDRGDDAIGLLILEALERRDLDGVDLHPGDGDPGWMIDTLDGRRCAVVVDAMRTGAAAPGTVVVIDASAHEVPAMTRLSSSHAMGAAASLELARALGMLPDRVVVVGVEAGSMRLGDEVTSEVANAVEMAADAVMEALADA
ncbi:MAG TPA: hydrogenase maturation protease [Acidimicrobiia bacterium]|nr:hydrogenase maturation protease [Acidimicrobiia bacterium]